MEHAQLNDVHVELAARAEQQKLILMMQRKKISTVRLFLFLVPPIGSLHQTINFLCYFASRTFTFSTRVYANGGHFATNTYELGNDQAGKKKSNNVELGFITMITSLIIMSMCTITGLTTTSMPKPLGRYKDFRLVQYAR